MDSKPRHVSSAEKKYSLRRNTLQKPSSSTNKKGQYQKIRCHYCRSKDMDKSYVICSNYPGCKCGFCHDCLKDHFGINPKKLASAWTCAVCQRICRCSRCLEKSFVQKKPEQVPLQDTPNDLMMINEWRKEPYLRNEKVYHGPKEYEEEDSGSDYNPREDKRRRRRRGAVRKHSQVSKKHSESPSRKHHELEENKGIENGIHIPVNNPSVPQTVPPASIYYTQFPYQFPLPTEPPKTEGFVQPQLPYCPLLYPGMEQQSQYFYMDPVTQGYFPFLNPGCLSTFSPMTPDQFSVGYGWQMGPQAMNGIQPVPTPQQQDQQMLEENQKKNGEDTKEVKSDNKNT